MLQRRYKGVGLEMITKVANLDWEKVKESFSEDVSLKTCPEELTKVNQMRRFHSKGKAYVKSLKYDRTWHFQGTERPLWFDHRYQGGNGERCQKILGRLCG